MTAQRQNPGTSLRALELRGSGEVLLIIVTHMHAEAREWLSVADVRLP